MAAGEEGRLQQQVTVAAGEEKRKCAVSGCWLQRAPLTWLCNGKQRSDNVGSRECSGSGGRERCGSGRGHGLQEIGSGEEEEPSTSFTTNKAEERHGSSRQRRLRIAVGGEPLLLQLRLRRGDRDCDREQCMVDGWLRLRMDCCSGKQRKRAGQLLRSDNAHYELSRDDLQIGGKDGRSI
ncbi:hypothetical protein BHE74_00043433 [Ensete ventricosum]|nr:hypothetical protein GW17_00028306 [Ensete ventricosum]RWW50326.1 hypothetical protein BHE74_00043433 [Ensete ventricosum]RZS18303.1 hypothetical protein BHM03_00050551 [Ensete ventricosum]